LDDVPIRRLPSLLIRFAVAGSVVLLASSCSSVTSDAARVNGETLSSSEFDSLLSAYVEAIPEFRTEYGSVYGEAAQGLLTDWITTVLIEESLAAEGVEVSATDNEEAMTSLMEQPAFASADAELRDFYAHIVAVRNVLEAFVAPSDTELSALYAEGIESSGVACARAILVETEEAAIAAVDRIDAGEDFADVAVDVSTDGSAAGGGVITNPADGTACIATDELANVFAPEFVDALRTAAVDETSAPFELPGVGWVVITLRPFDEVADDAAVIMSTGGSGDFIRNMADGAEVWVSSKYGTFDPTLPGVVPVG
jgi:hypothetical protein